MKRTFLRLLGVPTAVAVFLAISGCGDGKEPGRTVPTATATVPAPTATKSFTATKAPPTHTATPVPPTATVPPAATATPVGPTNTPTDTATPAPPTDTPTPAPPTDTPTITPTGGAAVCGDGIVNSPETCDDGGICIGGANNDQPCNQGGGAGGGAGVSGCPGGACRPVGGDGCAANCTFERTLVFDMGGFDVSQSHAVAQNPSFAVPIDLAGTLTFEVGDPTGPGGSVSAMPGDPGFKEGEIPVVQRVDKNEGGLLPVDVGPGVACACVRGFSARSCDGTPFGKDCTPNCVGGDSDGMPCEGDSQCPGGGACVSRDDVCVDGGQCSFIHGPGNQSSGKISCNADGLENIDYIATLDSSVSDKGSPTTTDFDGGLAGLGSALIFNTTAIGTIVESTCGFDPGNPEKGTDGVSCTDDDPDKGDMQTVPLTTGTAVAVLLNANGDIGVDMFPGATCGGTPCETLETGQMFDCTALQSLIASLPPGGQGKVPAGAAVAGAFASEGPPPLNDIVVPLVFVAVP